MECLQNEKLLALMRELIIEPAIKAAVSEALRARDEEITELRAQLKDTQSRLNQAEQFSRRNNVIISGLAEENNENSETLVMDIAKKMNLGLAPGDFESVYRLGKPISGKNRPLLVSFASLKKRIEFSKAKKSMKQTATKIYINDHLTPAHNTLMYELRQMKREKKIHAAWTELGIVKVRMAENTRAIQVRDLDDLIQSTPTALRGQAEIRSQHSSADTRTPLNWRETSKKTTATDRPFLRAKNTRKSA